MNLAYKVISQEGKTSLLKISEKQGSGDVLDWNNPEQPFVLVQVFCADGTPARSRTNEVKVYNFSTCTWNPFTKFEQDNSNPEDIYKRILEIFAPIIQGFFK